MASSTSLSKSAVPRRAAGLLALAGLAWAVGGLYTLFWNPEVQFYKHGIRVKKAYAQKLDLEYPHKVVVAGGSSCATSVDGGRILQRDGIPVLNMGLAAGLGAKVLVRFAMSESRPGDTLILALEPPLLGGSLEVPDLGVQISLAAGLPALLPERAPCPWLKSLLDLRPGAYHVFTLTGKLLLRRPMFAYQPQDFHPSGWHETSMTRAFPNPSLAERPLSQEGQAWLVTVRQSCAQRGIRVAYALPWYYCPPADAGRLRKIHARFLREVAAVIPVLKDPALGVHPVREHFANTNLHPTPAGAALHSDELARQIIAWQTWTLDELNETLAASD